MAHFQRLIWFALGWVLVGVPMFAYAAVDKWVYYETAYYGVRPDAKIAEKCAAVVAGRNDARMAYAGWSFVRETLDQTFPAGYASRPVECGYTLNGAGPYYDLGGGRLYRYSVPAPECETGTVNADGTCFVCPEGRSWNGSTCESPCQAKAGNSYGTANSWAMLDVDSVPSGAATFCDGTCSVRGGRVECESTSAGSTAGDFISLGSTCTVQGPFTYTGQDCGPAGSAPQLLGVDDVQNPWWDKGLDAKDCSAQGGYYGNVNGMDVCVRPQPGETFEKETSTGNDTSGTTETATDGTTTEKTTTTLTECKDGKCTTTTTTTTTTKGADGQQIGDTKTETKVEVKAGADFCKANPQHPQCAGTTTGGSFSGGCTTGFACTGDAVQCAIARVAHQQACATAVGEGVLGEFEQITGFDGTAPGQGLDRKEIDVPESLDVAEIGGGSGLEDQSFEVMGRSIEIPFSKLNQYIEMLGYAIMMIAWIGAWRIIAGAF